MKINIEYSEHPSQLPRDKLMRHLYDTATVNDLRSKLDAAVPPKELARWGVDESDYYLAIKRAIELIQID